MMMCHEYIARKKDGCHGFSECLFVWVCVLEGLRLLELGLSHALVEREREREESIIFIRGQYLTTKIFFCKPLPAFIESPLHR